MTVDRRIVGGLLQIGALVLALAALQASGSGQWQGRAVLLGVFVILTVSLNLASGFTGLFSLGHIGFMALGGYIRRS